MPQKIRIRGAQLELEIGSAISKRRLARRKAFLQLLDLILPRIPDLGLRDGLRYHAFGAGLIDGLPAVDGPLRETGCRYHAVAEVGVARGWS